MSLSQRGIMQLYLLMFVYVCCAVRIIWFRNVTIEIYICISIYIYNILQLESLSRDIKKWLLIVFISIFQSTVDTAAQFLQDGRHKTTAKGKSSNRNSELTEKSRELTESLKQLQQSYSSANIQVSYVKCFW